MINAQKINELTKRLIDALPKGISDLPKDIENNFHSVLQSAFNKMDLITREEFDAQTKVLERTRKKVEQLEAKLQEIEKRK